MDIKDPFIPSSTKHNIQPQNILIKDVLIYSRGRIKWTSFSGNIYDSTQVRGIQVFCEQIMQSLWYA